MNIHPPHEVTNQAKAEAIAESMERDGWAGRPLMVVDKGDHYQALTGSHRLFAAEIAGVDPQFVELPQDVSGEAADLVFALCNDASDDDDRVWYLRQLAEIDDRFDEALEIMEAEAAEN